MNDIFEWIYLILLLMSICFILFITSLKLYRKIRQHLPIKVNCWFCNVNSNVKYDEYNSWTCRHCEQYNGFDEDGGYNCDIPAQGNTQLNKRWKTAVNNEQPSLNGKTRRRGLCGTCNRNQEIKIQQLASFEPLKKGNFDKEIEQFRESLEKSYELCYSCQRIVKKSLNQIANNVLGSKLSQIGAKGLHVLDSHVIKAGSTINLRRISMTAMVALSILNFYNCNATTNLSKTHFDACFPPILTHFILLVVSWISAVKFVVVERFATVPFATIGFDWIHNNIANVTGQLLLHMTTENSMLFVNSSAVILSLKLVLDNEANRFGSILLMLLWNVNMMWHRIVTSIAYEFAGDLLKVFIALLLVVITLITSTTIRPVASSSQSKDNSFHRIYSDCEDDLSDISDGEGKCDDTSYSSTTRRRPFPASNLNNSPRSSSMGDLSHAVENQFRRSGYCMQSSQDLHSFPLSRINSSYSLSREAENCGEQHVSGFNSSFQIPEDCQNKLFDLNINEGKRRNYNTSVCPSSIASRIHMCQQQRQQLLTPARLNLNLYSSLNEPSTKASWVAGGFFMKNIASPQNRKQHSPQSDFVHPILSRTSSRSSGFESYAGSTHNGRLNDSRESSVAGDYATCFSEPTLVDSASKSMFERSSTKATTFMPILRKNQFTSIDSPTFKSESLANCYAFPWTNNDNSNFSQPVFRQFGTQRQVFHHNDSPYRNFTHPSGMIGSDNLWKHHSYVFDDK